MWKLALRNVFRHRSRTLLTLAAVGFGVVSLIFSTGFIHDFLEQFREATIHSQYGHLQVFKAGYYKFGTRAPFDYMIDDADKNLVGLRQLAHVADISPRVNFSGLLSNGRTTFPIVGEGIDPEKERRLSSFMVFTSGAHLSKNENFSIVIGQGVANTLNLKVGDAAILLLNTRGGALNTFDFKVAGIFQTFSKEYDDRAVRISLPAAAELLASKAVHSMVFMLSDTAHTDEVARQVGELLPKNQFELKTWFELADFYQKTVDLYGRYFLVLYLIILGLVLLSVANTVNMTLYERTGEFGTLAALGSRPRTLFGLIMREAALLGLLGSVGGVVTGILLAIIISAIGISMPAMPNANAGYTAHVSIVPMEVAKSFVIGLIGTLGAAILPARRAARLKVVEALRYN